MKYFMSLLALIFTLGLPACKKEEPAAHDHDHDSDSDHDHDSDAPAPESSHHHVAPNGGTLVALGDHFAHLEIKVDHNEGK